MPNQDARHVGDAAMLPRLPSPDPDWTALLQRTYLLG
jgi:hypothetical protein